MQKKLGTVISTIESPNTCEFSFVIESSDVHKGQFVQVPLAGKPVLGTISEIYMANRYFERAESVAEYSKLGQMSEQFPTKEWEYIVAKVRVHGVLSDKALTRSSMPVSCGSPAFAAEDAQLKTFLHIDEKGLNIGKLRHHGLEVKLNLTKLLQKHLAILAMSGSGKSYLAGVLIEELLDRSPLLGRIAVIAIDNHGEYVGYKDTQYRDRVHVFEGKKLRISLRALSARQLAEWFNMSPAASRALDLSLASLKKKFKEDGEPFGLDELINAIQSDSSLDKKENVRGPLLSALYDLKQMRLISTSDTLKSDLIKPGTLTVVDLSDLDDLRKKQMLVAHYGRKFFKQRKKGAIPPYVMLVEEAHNFCPEKMEKSAALSRSIINTIAREGRKFGASLCLISQRPVHLSTTALSQCNSTIILRITNPFDLDHIAKSCEGIDRNSQNSITSLHVGEALIIGEATGSPVFVNVRTRNSKTKTSGDTLEKLALSFEEKNKTKEDEIEAFL